jgi:hypothetical protein
MSGSYKRADPIYSDPRWKATRRLGPRASGLWIPLSHLERSTLPHV